MNDIRLLKIQKYKFDMIFWHVYTNDLVDIDWFINYVITRYETGHQMMHSYDQKSNAIK